MWVSGRVCVCVFLCIFAVLNCTFLSWVLGSMDDEASTGSKRSPSVEYNFNSSNNNINKRGRLCENGEDPRLENSSSTSFSQLGVSNFLQEEAPPWHHRQEMLESSLLESGASEWFGKLEQGSFGALESSNYQHSLQMFEAYNSITKDVQKEPKHVLLSNEGVLKDNSTSTSWWSVLHNAQQGEQKEDDLCSELQNSGSNAMDTNHSYGGSNRDQHGPKDESGLKEPLENDVTTMDFTDDLLLLVLSFLDQKSLCFSAMVCRQWRVASAHEDLWKCLSFEGTNVTSEKVGWLCSKFPRAVKLTLREVPFIDVVAREAMLSLRGLRNLILHKGILTESFFTALASGCFALQQLSISNAILGVGGFKEVLVCHANLQQLHVIKCRVMRMAIMCPLLDTLSLRQTIIVSVLLQCPRLLSLDVSTCTKLSDAGVRMAATACPALVKLDISQCSYVSDETLREISIACSNLSILDVSHCPNISLEGVSLPMLKEFRVQGCEGINSTSMAALSQCFMLESIRLDLCRLLTSVVLDLDRLQSLSLAKCSKCVDLTLMCPALVNITVNTCGALQHISIASLALKKLVLQKQVSLSTILLQCPSLSIVDLSECDELSDSICKVFSDGGGCPRLASLTLDNCESLINVDLSSASLESLSLAGCRHMESLELACEKLQRLNLDGCEHLTLASLAPVGLQSLNLGICPRVTDLKIEAYRMTSLDLKGCGALAHTEIFCPQLLFLDVFYCRRLEDKFLEATTSSCPLVNSLILASCPSIGPVGFSSLRRLWNLTVLDLSYTFVISLSPVFENCPRLKTLRLLACKYLEDTTFDLLHGKHTLPELRELDVSYGALGQAALEGLLSQCTHLTHMNINGCVNLLDLDWESKPQPQTPTLVHSKLTSLEDSCPLKIEGSTEDHEKYEEGSHLFEGNYHPFVSTHRAQMVKGWGDLPMYDRAWTDDQISKNRASPMSTVQQEEPFLSHALEYLNCVGCPNITKVVIMHTTEFWNLLSLNLSLGTNISEVRLECIRLSSLNLSNCTALKILDIKCPRLVSLWLQASNIEDSILEGVLRGCSALETLDVRNCSKVTVETLALVRIACPRLRQLLNCTSSNASMGFKNSD